jgi:hypothetical protein
MGIASTEARYLSETATSVSDSAGASPTHVSWSGISGATIDLESYRNDGIFERRDFAVTGNLIRGE